MEITNCKDCSQVMNTSDKACTNCGATPSGLLTLMRKKMLVGSFVKWQVSKNGIIVGTLNNGENLEIETDEDFLLEVTADFNGFDMAGRTQVQKGETKALLIKPGQWGIFQFLEQ